MSKGFGFFAKAVVATVAGFITGGGSFALGAFATRLATNIIIGGILSVATRALTPKPKIPNLQPNFSSFGESAQGRLVNVKQAIMTRQVVYGERRIAGNLIYAETTGSKNKFLHLIYAVAGHEIDSFVKFQINEDVVTLDDLNDDGEVIRDNNSDLGKYDKAGKKFVRFKYHTGSDTQQADETLVEESDDLWTAEHKLQGIAYVYVRLLFSTKAFPNGIPNISAYIRGKKVFDPRTSTTAYSANSALCIRDFLTNTRYGLGANSTEINDTVFSSAANSCDEVVTLATPTEQTFNTKDDIDNDDEEITINAHPYATGDSVVYSNKDGTNLSGLTNGTTYYIIKVNANKIKLATSSTNAYAGTAIDITASTEDEGETQALQTLTEKRYECNGIVDTGQTPARILEDMTSSCIGLVNYSGGKWAIKVGVYNTPSVTLGDDDLRGAIQVTTRNSRRDSFNAIKGVFSNPAEKFQPQDFPPITSSTFETEDNSERIFSDIELPFTTSSAMAQRIAKIILYRNREQITINFPAKLTGFNVEVGDTIYINNTRLGFSSKPFEVSSWKFATETDGTLGIDLSLREISSTVYDWNAEEQDIISNNTVLPDVFNIDPPGITASDTLTTFNQEAITTLVAEVTSSDEFVDNFEVEAKQATLDDSFYVNMGRASGSRFELTNVKDGVIYDVRARAITSLGSSSEFNSVQHQIVGKSAQPSDVTGFSVNVIGSEAHLTWTPVSDADLSHYKIRHSDSTSGATYQNAIDLVPKVARPAQSVTVPALTGTYFCKAVDKLGLLSETPASSVVQIDNIKFLNDVSTVTENPTFGGTKTNVVKTSSNTLILDTTALFDSASGNFDDAVGLFDGGGGTLATSGTYEFATKTDLGAKFTARLTPTITVGRLDYVSLFDDASGLFDAREGNFDGDVTAFDTTNVEFEIASTDDDPNSGSPTFTAFRKFIVGDYTARGFKYRINMTTSDTQATPEVSALAIKVSMQDRTIAESNISSTTNTSGKTITFSPAFKVLQGLSISATNLASGDFYAITSKSENGFTIEFFNSSSATVDREFDYVARGFGEAS